LAATVSPGPQHESTVFADLLDEVAVPRPTGRPRSRPSRVAGDKAYSVKWIRDWLRGKGIAATIPRKTNERRRGPFDKQTYKRRNVVERCIGWLKECRRVATRFEKLARNYLAMIKLAMIRHYLRTQFSDRA
jgi:transposase